MRRGDDANGAPATQMFARLAPQLPLPQGLAAAGPLHSAAGMRLPKRIPSATTSPHLGARAFDHALAMAAVCKATMVVFNAFGRALELGPDSGRRERAARAALDECLARARAAGVEAHGSARWIEPAEGILRAITEARPDLVVLGTHGRRGLSRALVGSVAEEVVRASATPVLLLHAAANGSVPPKVAAVPLRVLVPTDFADASRRALAETVQLAQASGASIVLVHAMTNPAYSSANALLGTAVAIGQAAVAAHQALREALGAHEGARVPMTSKLVEGPVAAAVHRLADELDADLIALGTRARGGVGRGRRCSGSVADDIVRGAARPVLVAFHAPPE